MSIHACVLIPSVVLGLLVAACGEPSKAAGPATVQPAAATSAMPVAAATSVAVATAAPSALGPALLTIRASGGRCVNGLCESLLTVNRDGTYTRTSPQSSPQAGTIDQARLAALAREMARADFAAVKSIKFTGTCPTAYDGQEFTYTFYTASGPEEVGSCRVRIDTGSALFVATQAIVDTVNRE